MILHARPIIVEDAGKINSEGATSKLRLGGPVSSQTEKAVITDEKGVLRYVVTMPWGLRRFKETGQLHFLTFSCYKRRPNFANVASRTTFETSLEQARQPYGLCVYGYVVMPEHIHMLVNEPEPGSLSRVLSMLHRFQVRNHFWTRETRSTSPKMRGRRDRFCLAEQRER